MRKLNPIFFLIALLYSFNLNAQNVGINSDGSNPDASAMLDVKSPSLALGNVLISCF